MKRTLLSTLVLMALLSACSRPSDHAPPAYNSEPSTEQSMEQSATASMALESGDLSDKQSPQDNRTDHQNPALVSPATDQSQADHLADKKFVIHVSSNFSVKDVVETSNTLEKLTLELGGYVQSRRIFNETNYVRSYPIGNEQLKTLTEFMRHGELVLRIPNAKVSEFLAGVQGQVVFLDGQEFHAKDVVLDLERQALNAKIEAEKQALLSPLSPTKSDDLADKSNHVNTITQSKYQQALAKLDRQALNEQVTFSTILLNFRQNPQLFASITPDIHAHINKDKQANFTHRLGEKLTQGWQSFLEMVLWLAGLWAFVVGAIVFILLWKKVLKPLWHKPLWKNNQKPNTDDSH